MLEDIKRILIRFSWLNTPFIFFFSIGKADRKNKNKYQELHAVSFQDHSIWQMFMSTLGWILKKFKIYNIDFKNDKILKQMTLVLFVYLIILYVKSSLTNQLEMKLLAKTFYSFLSLIPCRHFSSCSSIVYMVYTIS